MKKLLLFILILPLVTTHAAEKKKKKIQIEDLTVKAKENYDKKTDKNVQSMRNTSYMLIGGGTVGLLAGILLIKSGFDSEDECFITDLQGNCQEYDDDYGKIIPGLILASAGAGLTGWGIFKLNQASDAENVSKELSINISPDLNSISGLYTWNF